LESSSSSSDGSESSSDENSGSEEEEIKEVTKLGKIAKHFVIKSDLEAQ